ncbi:HNH endonuclease [Alsobacter sp. SYSU BS001988]
MTSLAEFPIENVEGLSAGSIRELRRLGYETLGQISEIEFHNLYGPLGFDQAKLLLRAFKKLGGSARFSRPEWSEADWEDFVRSLVTSEIVTWSEIAMAICGELNPPQVGTAIASNSSFQAKFPPRQTMRAVMEWFYSQSGKCEKCGTRLYLEADHKKPKEQFLAEGLNVSDADTLDNLQLLCKRCNVTKRQSHELGGISFGPAQSVLIWILLFKRPTSREQFYSLCRQHGLTMATIRFDEAWAFAEWLKREGRYQHADSPSASGTSRSMAI